MRTTLILSLLLSFEAHAQFANTSVGVGLNSYRFFYGPEDWAPAITLEASRYIESGFEVFLRVPFLLLHSQTGADTPTGAGWIIGGGGQLGARYLFLEEQLRPWVGLELAGLVLNKKPAVEGFGGLGASAGVDYFVAENLSIGARGFCDALFDLNVSPRLSVGLGLSFAAYF